MNEEFGSGCVANWTATANGKTNVVGLDAHFTKEGVRWPGRWRMGGGNDDESDGLCSSAKVKSRASFECSIAAIQINQPASNRHCNTYRSGDTCDGEESSEQSIDILTSPPLPAFIRRRMFELRGEPTACSALHRQASSSSAPSTHSHHAHTQQSSEGKSATLDAPLALQGTPSLSILLTADHDSAALCPLPRPFQNIQPAPSASAADAEKGKSWQANSATEPVDFGSLVQMIHADPLSAFLFRLLLVFIRRLQTACQARTSHVSTRAS